jgi:hypothetical protein
MIARLIGTHSEVIESCLAISGSGYPIEILKRFNGGVRFLSLGEIKDNLFHGLHLKKSPVVDLAFITFESSQDHPLANMSPLNRLKLRSKVFLAGFTAVVRDIDEIMDLFPGDGVKQKDELTKDSSQLNLTISGGPISALLPEWLSYNLRYFVDLDGKRGMSGGPVFDEDGALVGVFSQILPGSLYDDNGTLKPRALFIPLKSVQQAMNQMDKELETDWSNQ